MYACMYMGPSSYIASAIILIVAVAILLINSMQPGMHIAMPDYKLY